MWNKDDWLYELEDGRLWSTKEVGFVDQSYAIEWMERLDEDGVPLSPIDEHGNHNLKGLHDALVFYNLPLGELATEEELFTSLRIARNQRLAATDYLAMYDYPLNEDQEKILTTYRQALRDITKQEGSPWDGGGENTPWPVLNLNN